MVQWLMGSSRLFLSLEDTRCDWLSLETTANQTLAWNHELKLTILRIRSGSNSIT